jgi:beta-galactosidase
MKLGVCYYPEHWPQSRWVEDAKLMREAGLSIVRIAEFAWQLMEPGEGRFQWAWLDEAIDTLAGEGLQVVLGTPTATPPAWLCREYPDVLPVDIHGHVREFGSRRHYCVNSPKYQHLSDRIVEAMAERYGSHPAVVAWQLDNEFGCHETTRCYCDNCRKAFQDWLKQKYQTLQTLNDAWGAQFWSQTYTSWDQVFAPNLTVTEANPSHVLDYYRFSSDSFFKYQQAQIDILRRYIGDRQITTNFMGTFPELDYHKHAQALDFATWDSYPTGYLETMTKPLYGAQALPGRFAPDLGDPYITGFCHDLTWGCRQEPFWVMEQQCGNINWADYNPGVGPDAPRLWTWHAMLNGAEAVVYFRWRACRFAQEQHHSGLLRHDGTKAVGYQDVLRLHKEKELLSRISTIPKQAPAAILSNYEDLWALQLQPHNSDYDYQGNQFAYYYALQRLGIATDIVSSTADLARYKLLIVPTAFLVDEALTSRLQDYVEKGGQLVIGIRSGFKDETNVVSDQPLPGRLRDLVGARVEDWHSLSPEMRYSVVSEIEGLNGHTQLWAESIIPETAEVLAFYQSGPFTGKAALTVNQLGAGRVFYLGCYPHLQMAEALVEYLAKQAEIEFFDQLPEGVIAVRRGPFHVFLNFTKEEKQLMINGTMVSVSSRDLIVIE